MTEQEMEQHGTDDINKDLMFIAECMYKKDLTPFQQFVMLSMIEYYYEYYKDIFRYSMLLSYLEDKINPPQSILNPN